MRYAKLAAHKPLARKDLRVVCHFDRIIAVDTQKLSTVVPIIACHKPMRTKDLQQFCFMRIFFRAGTPFAIYYIVSACY